MLSLARITSAFVFTAFQLASIWRSNQLLTVKTSGLLFDFSAGWNFDEEKQTPPRITIPSLDSASFALCRSCLFIWRG
jgi:hypothetical protein